MTEDENFREWMNILLNDESFDENAKKAFFQLKLPSKNPFRWTIMKLLEVDKSSFPWWCPLEVANGEFFFEFRAENCFLDVSDTLRKISIKIDIDCPLGLLGRTPNWYDSSETFSNILKSFETQFLFRNSKKNTKKKSSGC